MQRVLSSSILLAAILCIVLGMVLGCSPERKYKVLSFFFDGVPAPGGALRVGDGAQTVSYIHKPYADGKCGGCHGSDDVDMSITRATVIGDVNSSVCLKCHQQIPNAHTVMHGPVAAGECLMCHAPHDSTVPHLLKAAAPRVCVQCHTPEVMAPRRPEHQDEKANCLDCHLGHGGEHHGLLRSREATTRPTVAASGAATQPSAAGTPSGAATQPSAAANRPAATTKPSIATAPPAVAVGDGL